MQIVSRIVDRSALKSEKHTGITRDKTVLSFYNEPPKEELSLDEFEQFAFDRLQMLRKIENIQTRNYEGNDLKSRIDKVCVILLFVHLFFLVLIHIHLLTVVYICIYNRLRTHSLIMKMIPI